MLLPAEYTLRRAVSVDALRRDILRETVRAVLSMYDSYNGTGMQMALFFACLIYLIVQKKEKEKQYLFAGYTLLFFIICFFPVTAKVIMACIGQEVYWRLFWLLPTVIVTAYTAVQVLLQMDGKIKRYLLLFVMLTVVVMTGTIVYNGTVFDRKQNWYKLPQDTVDICDIIERDAAENGILHKKLITTNDLVISIRQYDAQIRMPYGNEVVVGDKAESENAAQIFRIMGSENKNWEALLWYAAMEDCNYFAYPTDEITTDYLISMGLCKVGGNETYSVFRTEQEKSAYDGKWLLTQYGGKDGNQLMFYTLQDSKGHLIVIDGGWVTDADYVKRVIKLLGNRVDAWVITHPHSDHAGAFTEIYKNPGKIKIKKVYAVDMAPPELCLANASWDETTVYEEWLKLTIPQLQYVHAGDTFEIEGLAFEVFNAYDDYVDELSDDLLNDGSMMFKVTAKKESMLFCADVGKHMSDYLLETYGEALKADYIQMGHHGNGGLKKDFYKSIGAKAAFFDAPDWLMQDRSGRFTTMKNTYLMAEEGAAVYSFSTTPNQIILK